MKEAQSIAANADEPTGRLKVASPETLVRYHLPPVLRRFQKKFPRVDLSFLPLSAALVPQQIARRDIDFAFLIGDLAEHRGLVIEDLAPEPMALAVSPKHPLAGRSSVRAGFF